MIETGSSGLQGSGDAVRMWSSLPTQRECGYAVRLTARIYMMGSCFNGEGIAKCDEITYVYRRMRVKTFCVL